MRRVVSAALLILSGSLFMPVHFISVEINSLCISLKLEINPKRLSVNLLDIVLFGQVRVWEQPKSPLNFVGPNFLGYKTEVPSNIVFVGKLLDPGFPTNLVWFWFLCSANGVGSGEVSSHATSETSVVKLALCCLIFWGKVEDIQAGRNRYVSIVVKLKGNSLAVKVRDQATARYMQQPRA